MKKNYWPVTTEDERPSRMDGTCFHCGIKIGGEHKHDCVIRERTIVVEFRIKMVRKVPEDWNKKMIEFNMNESSSCKNNILREINNMAERCGCLCSYAKGIFLGEAGPGDEDYCHLYINPDKTKEENQKIAQQLNGNMPVVKDLTFINTGASPD
jgi:hypothetical protein